MPALGYTYDDHLPADFSAQSLRDDVRTGLTAPRKWLPPKWFYDKVGSELFEDITALREYYPTRTERSILADYAAEIVGAAGSDTLIELGSGSSEKTRLLLDAMLAHASDRAALGEMRDGDSGDSGDSGDAGRPMGTAVASAVGSYTAWDVSEDALRSACAALVSGYPRLRVAAMRADFTHQLDLLPGGAAADRRMVAFLGSTIGNFEPTERAAFLRSLRAQLGEHDHFLLGADLVKSADILVPAYDDAAGVTAAFNLNLLDVLNHSLRADFDRGAFDHVVVWDDENEWIEMRLRATRDMVVHLPDLDLDVHFERGEDVRTEISAKFRQETLTAELAAAGFVSRGWWTDRQNWFALSLWGTA